MTVTLGAIHYRQHPTTLPNGGLLYRFVGPWECAGIPQRTFTTLRQRWYDPQLLGFCQRQYGGDKGPHLYGYAANCPNTLVDPTGLQATITPGTTQAFGQQDLENAMKIVNDLPSESRGIAKAREYHSDRDTATVLRSRKCSVWSAHQSTSLKDPGTTIDYSPLTMETMQIPIHSV